MARGAGRALGFTAMAVACGSVAVVGLHQLFGTYQERLEAAQLPEDRVYAIVAAKDLYQGVTITDDDLYAVQVPPRFLPDRIFLNPDHVVGRIPRERILANELVRADRLANPEGGVGLNGIIPRGMRALSVDIDDGAALAGFLNPGNYVDVLVTITPDDEAQGRRAAAPETRTILQAVFVLGVNSRMKQEAAEVAEGRRRTAKPSVTLLVSPEQAEQLAHARNLGELRLTLRTETDVLPKELQGVDMADLRRKLDTHVEILRHGSVAHPPREVVEDCSDLLLVGGSEKQTLRFRADGTPCE